ncbi:MAG: hypothetical protein Q9219_006023 [cf. Caloplaca sp. 3 TL-2023]
MLPPPPLLLLLLLLTISTLLSSASTKENPGPQRAPVAPTTVTVSTTIITSTSTTPTKTTPNPTPAPSAFLSDLNSYRSAEATNPLFSLVPTGAGSVAASLAQAQEASYLNALMTATTTIPLPPFITALPAEQRAYMSSFHAHVASIASKDYGRAAAVVPKNGTANNGTVTAGGNTTVKGSPSQRGSPTQLPPAPGGSANRTDDSGAGRLVGEAGGVYKMAVGAMVGVWGFAMFL